MADRTKGKDNSPWEIGNKTGKKEKESKEKNNKTKEKDKETGKKDKRPKKKNNRTNFLTQNSRANTKNTWILA